VATRTGRANSPILEVRNLSKTFVSRGIFARGREVVAAEHVSFRINCGEAVALVGESGSGKSTIARLLVRLEKADGGEILLDGQDMLARERRHASLAYRGRVQMVFQDPFGSLNPVHTIAYHLIRPLLRHHRTKRSDAHADAVKLLRTVGLEPAEEFVNRHPYELSGGQRQRVAIARALAVDPDLLVADEPTSMLDVSIRMGILNLLAHLKEERGLAILLITHDLASARYLAERILVLFRGRVVEEGPSDAIVERPAHPYTRALLASIADIAGQEPSVKQPPEAPGTESELGCPFAPRCRDRMEVCWKVNPQPRRLDDRLVRCHLYPAGEPNQRS
jgi:peptide/nickel transport system ATP-binding protein